MAAACEFLGDFADINSPPAAERAANPAIGQFDEQGGDLDGGDSLTFIDEVFGIFVFCAGVFEVLLREVLRGESAIEMKFDGIEHRGHKAETLGGETLEDIVVYLRRIDACVGQFGAGAKDGGAGIIEVKPAGVCGDTDEEGLGNFGCYGPASKFEQVEDDEANGGRGGIDKLDVA